MKLFIISLKKARKILNNNAKFAVRKIQKGDTVTWLPVVKAKGLFNDWMPIVKVYDHYLAIPYEKPGGLTEEECLEHLAGYKLQLEKEAYENSTIVEYFDLDQYKGDMQVQSLARRRQMETSGISHIDGYSS